MKGMYVLGSREFIITARNNCTNQKRGFVVKRFLFTLWSYSVASQWWRKSSTHKAATKKKTLLLRSSIFQDQDWTYPCQTQKKTLSLCTSRSSPLSVCLSVYFLLSAFWATPDVQKPLLKYRSQKSAAGNPRNPNNSYGIPSRPNDANIPNFTFPKKNLMTILRDADMWQLETREKPTQDEEGEKKLTRRQSSVRTLDKAVQDDAGSGGGAFGQTLFIRCFTCSSGM